MMKEYIVFDLEWNQSANGKAASVEELPFEIIEIGAVKLDEEFRQVDQFHRLIRPCVYRQMHYAISEVTHMNMGELREHGEQFADAAREFVEWCGDGAVYCSWGSMDLTELQRNMHYFGMENPFSWPLLYYDVQKLYGLISPERERISLDSAVVELGIPRDRPFHRASDDAYYTGKVLQAIAGMDLWKKLEHFLSVDYYRLPENRREEIQLVFPGYSKFVSQVFTSKEEALKDRRVAEMRCYECGRALRKKVRWFSPNQKIYYALAICPEHGSLKGKIRMKHLADQKVFAVKTLKLTDEAGAEKIRERREAVSRKRAVRNRAKHHKS